VPSGSINTLAIGGGGGNFNYQWIDCSTGMAIAGETDSSFMYTMSGMYRVAVMNQSGCSDTSFCITVTAFIAPDQPTLVTSADTICEGNDVNITVSATDTLNSGTNWVLYENDLTSTPIASSPLGGFVITSSVTTNYIVRGEGNGVIGEPDTVTIIVNALPSNSVTQIGDTLFAALDNYNYQWIDCSSNTIITGADSSTYVVTTSGDYRLAVTDLTTNCSDTSACINVTIVGVSEFKETIQLFVYPNPSNGQFTLEIAENERVFLEVLSSVGQVVLSKKRLSKKEDINLNGIDSGLYIIRLTNEKGEAVYKKILIR